MTIILAALAIPVAALIGLMLMQLLEDALLPSPADSRKPEAEGDAAVAATTADLAPTPDLAQASDPAPVVEGKVEVEAGAAVAAPPAVILTFPAPARPYASGRGRPATRRPSSCAKAAAQKGGPRWPASRPRQAVPRSA
ncbi:hypothetical protein BKM31_48150 [[Actinomadura] parvosata subsp. kistnae]|uniref:Uncharacterized protein n=1 Tax=[Actinomadura] parvosata subsp. kistnae TaxID=1909395 RepID=A0A1V0ADE2_9ACTN|nr:hypothetical protein [Nonomuraea sp. ATCC 55076]AQZ68215.1 hypothetical protein BKM31_48150 [Nonomuraea sp. ATCC 55076]